MVTKKQLVSELSCVVKTAVQEQKNGTDDSVSSDVVNAACSVLEAIFIQGLRETYVSNKDKSHRDKYPEPNFWPFVQKFTHRNVRAQIGNLNQIKNDIGKARVWLRIALNDGLLENYITSIAREPQIVRHYYHRNALLRDGEQVEVVTNYVRALSKFTFKAPVNSNMLNSWTPTPLKMAGLLDVRPKRSAPRAIYGASSSVDEEEEGVDEGEDAVSALEFEGLEDNRMLSDTQSDAASVVFSTVSPKSAPMPKGFFGVDRSGVFSDVDSVLSSEQSAITTDDVETTQELRLQTILDSLVDKNTSNFLDDNKKPSITEEKIPTAEIGVNTDENSTESEEIIPPSTPPLEEKNNSVGILAPPAPDNDLEFSFSPGNSLLAHRGWSSGDFTTDAVAESPAAEQFPSSSPVESDFSAALHQILEKTVLKRDETPRTRLESSSTDRKESLEEESTVGEVTVKTVDSEYVLVENQTPSVEPAEKAFRLSFLTKIGQEIGLNGQDFKCNSCKRSIGLMFGSYRICHFDGHYYCNECHLKEESVIPARILYNWDLKPRKVCRASKAFLDHVADQPLIRLSQSNATLTDVVEKINEVKNLRLQLSYVAMYLLACRELVADDLRKRIWPKEYLYLDVDLYSTIDLTNAATGQLQKHLKSVILFATKHVLDACRLCASKGFVCEICNDSKIIYPFQIDITQRCNKCNSVYHKNCADGRPCPKCLRKEMYSKSALDSGIEMPPFGDV